MNIRALLISIPPFQAFVIELRFFLMNYYSCKMFYRVNSHHRFILMYCQVDRMCHAESKPERNISQLIDKGTSQLPSLAPPLALNSL